MGSSAPSLSDVPGWFRYLDTDKSGTICKKEIVKRVKELSLDPAELDVIIATFDLNGDGEFN